MNDYLMVKFKNWKGEQQAKEIIDSIEGVEFVSVVLGVHRCHVSTNIDINQAKSNVDNHPEVESVIVSSFSNRG